MLAHLIGGFTIYAGEDGGNAGRLGFALLQCQSDTWAGTAGGAAAHGVNEHKSGALALHGIVDACWVGEFFDANAGEFGAHGIS
jgi:hypothetical protein